MFLIAFAIACCSPPEAEILAIVRENFYDRARAEAWAKENAGYAASARNPSEFAAATRTTLAKLRASHTAYFTPDDPEYYGLLSIFRGPLKLPAEAAELESIGVDVDPENFVRTVFAGSPAAKAGVQRGDQIVSVEGAPFHPVRSLRGKGGKALRIQVRRRADQQPLDLTVTPRRIDPQAEWLQAQKEGAKLIEREGKRLAYVPLYSAAGEQHLDILREDISGRFADADALILDFRNGWGGASPMFVSLFDRNPPLLEQIDRNGKRTHFDFQWRKPLFVLINKGSRSGKEAAAYSIKKHKLGTLVGERTAGAVLAGRPFPLEDKSLLYLAVMDVLVDGERLEGRGVEPDIAVGDELRFAEGKDPQLEKAIESAGR